MAYLGAMLGLGRTWLRLVPKLEGMVRTQEDRRYWNIFDEEACQPPTNEESGNTHDAFASFIVEEFDVNSKSVGFI